MKNKKKVLIAVAAMALVAAATAGVSTAAWFTSTATVATVKQNEVQASIGVTQDTTIAAVSIKVNVHLTATPIEGSGSPILTTWAQQSGEGTSQSPYTYSISDTPTDNTTLVKGNVDSRNNQIVTLALPGNSQKVVKVFKLEAYATHVESDSQRQTAAVAALAASSNSMSFEIKYDTTFTPGSGEKLNANEVFFYTGGASATMAEDFEHLTYAKGSEKDGSVTDDDAHKTSVALSSLVDGSALKGSTAKVTVGYLYVRIDGSKRVHINDTAYSTKLICDGTETNA